MKKIVCLVFLLTLIISCSQGDSDKNNSEVIDVNALNQEFFAPRVNTFFNKKYNVVFNSNFIKPNELNYLKQHRLNEFINTRLNRLRGFAMYYRNADTENNEVTIQKIIAFSIYEFNDNDEVVHKFFIKKDDAFHQEFSLKENVMNTSNQIFLLSHYFGNIFTNEIIGISNFGDIDELSKFKNKKGANEFNLFKAVTISENIRLAKISRRPFVLTAYTDEECDSSCGEQGNGACDGGFYCDIDVDGGCKEKEIKNEAIAKNIITEQASLSLFKTDLYYELRDGFMFKYEIGKKYINYYYAVSNFLEISDFKLSTIYKMIATLPDFNNSLGKLLDDSTEGNEIIITESLKDDILSIVEDLKDISQNKDYLTVMSELENDIILMSNKSKSTLLSELQ